MLQDKYQTQPIAVNRRYDIAEELGKGGMGVVYRAVDRLTGDVVALKRVTVPGEQLQFASITANDDFRIALAQEFKTLASLRHPHIISVLDYGFDALRQPYFTMELLDNPQTILASGQTVGIEQQVHFLIQVLQSLAYLHRRDIIHRDLKPDNVQVVNGQVKVLDFGLAVAREFIDNDNDNVVGTLAYMAPEVLQGLAASAQSDFYAVGVIAYELFAGRHPFNTADLAELLQSIVHKPADVSSLDVSENLSFVIQRLLSKHPYERYVDAHEVIRALCEASEVPIPSESTAIRESFLQAAGLVGRDNELDLLTGELEKATVGQGSAWLLAGESGVGKSRLMDEIRTLSLVAGGLVMRGQAINDVRSPYLLWREVVRWLALSEISTHEASVLKMLVADISALVGYDVPDAPELSPQATQDRLLRVIEDVFHREFAEKQSLMVLILEDVHWADNESVKLLRRLNVLAEQTRLLVLGSYRDDERPDLPAEVPLMQTLKLHRLDEDSIRELSVSMLGDVGRDKAVVALLQRETEGNVFFLVEVVRALAEATGSLDDIGTMTLPDTVFAGGMHQIVQSRLAHVEQKHMALLQAAAVAGRQLDLTLLESLNLADDMSQWLGDCADAAVLDVYADTWRFAHDKLREGLLEDLSDTKRRELHQRVAEAIEAIYPDDPEKIIPLSHHWGEVGDVAKERYYAALAGEQALANGSNQNAVTFFERAITLYDSKQVSELQYARWKRLLGEAYYGLGQMPASFTNMAAAAAILGHPVPKPGFWRLLVIARSGLRQMFHRLLPARFISRPGNRREALIEASHAYERIAEIIYFRNDLLGAVHAGLTGLNLAEMVSPDSAQTVRGYSQTAVAYTLFRLQFLSRMYEKLARRTSEKVKVTVADQWMYMLEGMNYAILAEWEKSEAVQLQSIQCAIDSDEPKRWSESTYQLATLKWYTGEFEESYDRWRSIYEAAEQRGDRQAMIWGLQGMVINATRLQLHDEDIQILEAMDIDEVMADDNGSIINVYGGIAAFRMRRGEIPAAFDAVEKSLIYIESSTPTSYFTLSGYACTAEAAIKLWEVTNTDPTFTASDRDKARNNANRARKAGHRFARLFKIARPFAMRWQGLYEWLEGNEGAAHKSWEKSVQAAEKFIMPYEKALTHYEIGRHLPANDSSREDQLTQAMTLFARLKAQYDAELARQALIENTTSV